MLIGERQEIVSELCTQGKIVKEIAEELGVSIATIYKDITYLKEIGKLPKMINPKTIKIEKRREKVVELYNQGKSIKGIAEELGVSTMTIYIDIKHLKEIGKIQEKVNDKTVAVEANNRSCQKNEVQVRDDKETIKEYVDIEAARKLTKEYLIKRLREFLELQEYDKINEWIDEYRDNPFLTDSFKQKLLTLKKEVEKQRENDKTTTVKRHANEER